MKWIVFAGAVCGCLALQSPGCAQDKRPMTFHDVTAPISAGDTRMLLEGTAILSLRDSYGDPLPAEAVARLGTLRFRHASPVVSLVYLAEGKMAASAGRTIRLWDAATGREARRSPSHYGTIFSVAASPDGKTLASGFPIESLLS